MSTPLRNQNRDSLIEEYHDYVQGVAVAVARRFCISMSHLNDLKSAGYLGLIDAADRFNEEEGVAFKRFAFLRIRGAMVDYLRENSKLSRSAYKFTKALNAISDYREQELNSIKRGEKRDRSDSAKSRLGKILDYAAKGALAYAISDIESISNSEEFADQDPNPEAKALQEERHRSLLKAIDKLPKSQRQVIFAYYIEDLNMEEIRTMLGGVSRSWVSRLHAKGLEGLKIIIEQQGL